MKAELHKQKVERLLVLLKEERKYELDEEERLKIRRELREEINKLIDEISPRELF